MRFLIRTSIVFAILAGAARLHAQPAYEVLSRLEPTAVSPYWLLRALDGDFYGISLKGGASDSGTIFRMAADGTVRLLHSFPAGVRGSQLIQTSDGRLYGITADGGAHRMGTVFRMEADGTVTTLHEFAGGYGDGSQPTSLIEGTDGNLYGLTLTGGPKRGGTAFRLAADGTFSLIHLFAAGGSEGHWPSGLLQASDGWLYGLTGGDESRAFRMSSDGALSVLHVFTAGDQIGLPTTPLIQAADGFFYGATATTVFRMSDAGSVTTVAPLCAPSRYYGAAGSLVQAPDGSFYGASSGGTGYDLDDSPGAVFRVVHGVCTVLHISSDNEGLHPGTLINGGDGQVYGTAREGVRSGYPIGTVFSIDASSRFTVRHTFARNAISELTEASDGNLYGVTRHGGRFGRGAIFRVLPSGAFSEIYSFAGGLDGGFPLGRLVEQEPGVLYGTTYRNGAFDAGTIFRVTFDGRHTTVHAFRGEGDGYPVTGMIRGTDGNLYGTTGGNAHAADPVARPGTGGGTIYRVARDGRMTVLRAFSRTADGPEPFGPGPLTAGNDGNLYGTTEGGPLRRGTAFRMTLAGDYTTIHTFTGSSAAERRPEALVAGADGAFYGSHLGGIMRLSTTGATSLLEAVFGAELSSQGSDGSLYGTVYSGFPQVYRVFALTLDGGYYLLSGIPPDDGVPGGLRQGADGLIYGATVKGSGGGGLIFRYRSYPVTPPSLTVSSRAGGAQLSWKPTNAVAYQVTRRTTAGGEVVLASRVTGTTFVDTTAVKGEHYYYVVSAVNAFGESLPSYAVPATGGRGTAGDFDGDGAAEAAVFRPSEGSWWGLNLATGQPFGTTWGRTGDVPAPGDYDGDGLADLAVYRPATGTWWLLDSSRGYASYRTYRWGIASDEPVAADYDGDGTTDIAVYRPSTGMWWVLQSTTGFTRYVTFEWGGEAGDLPQPRDYDGDGKADFAVFRSGTGDWRIYSSSTGLPTGMGWGARSDLPVPADYDGDGRTDLAIYRVLDQSWWVRWSTSQSYVRVQWGLPGDVPTPGDFDGDGRADFAIYRPTTGEWWIKQSNDGQTKTYKWGNTGDVPALGIRN